MTDKQVLDIVLATQSDAVAVMNQLVLRCMGYGYVTVEELYELVGLHGTFEDARWGWNNLSDAFIAENPQGWQLKLPKPSQILVEVKSDTLEDRIASLEARVQSLETNTRNIF